MTALLLDDFETDLLGQHLLNAGLVSEDQLRIALREQKETNALLGLTLVRLGFLAEGDLARTLALRTGAEALAENDLAPDPDLLAKWPKASALRHHALPLRMEDDELCVATSDPYDLIALDEMRRVFSEAQTLRSFIVEESVLLSRLDKIYGASGALEDLLAEMDGEASAALPTASPIVRLLDQLLTDAVDTGASDLHFEPESGFVRLRFRIDGRLCEIRSLHRDHWPALSHRIKILAGMNIADQRSVQDGRFQRSIGGASIDFRVALMPTVWGETIVIRVLDHRRGLLPLEDLGFDAAAQQALESILTRPEGLMLVTGPTGSGKTTTLYALLRQLAALDVNIVTLEEPVEYQIPLLRQTALQEERGFGFAEGVRAVLRMDPDIVLIGEIRDAETAQNALRASMTGHRVFSTLHCNDALGAIARLMDLGLGPHLISGNLSGLMAQRLVRRLCPACKTERKATEDEARKLGCDPNHAPSVFEACGCAACSFLGTKGRVALTEILPLTPAIDDLIARGASRLDLLQTVQKTGFRRLREDGAARVLAGEIAMNELCRVVDMRIGV